MVMMFVMLVVMVLGGSRGQCTRSEKAEGDDGEKSVPDFHGE